MFLTILLPEGIPQQLVMPHYFLQEMDNPIFFWIIRFIVVATILGSAIACIYFERKSLKTEDIDVKSGEKEEL